MRASLLRRWTAWVWTGTISENSQTLGADKIVACICSETQVYLAQEFCFVFCCLYSRFFCMSFVADLVQPIARLAPSPRASSPTARCECVPGEAHLHLNAPCKVLDSCDPPITRLQPLAPCAGLA